MKVRHNISLGGHQQEYEVCGQSETHYFISNKNWDMCALPKDQFTIIQEDRWQNVTGECEINDRYELFHREGFILNPMCAIARKSYRLRKVRYPISGSGDTVFKYGDAFIIERKVNE